MSFLKDRKVKSKIFHFDFLPKNQRGTDKLLSVYWFAILFIVTAGIVYMASEFYGEPYDVRDVEANLLVNKVADCLTDTGVIIENWESLSSENFLDFCNLNFNVEETSGWNNDQIFVRVKILNFSTSEVKNFFAGGNFNLENSCEVDGDLICLERSVYSIDSENNQFEIKINVVINKEKKNV